MYMSQNVFELSKEFAENMYSTIVELSPMPVYVCAGADMVVTVANKATLKAWGKDKSVIGKKFTEALPEMTNQPFFQLLTQVYNTGVPYHTENDKADFLYDGQLVSFYYKFSYQPLINKEGAIWGVLCIATDVTELVMANKKAEESEERFKSLILKAPVALCVLKGLNFIVEIANDLVLEIWGVKEEQVLNKPIFEGLPEARGQGLDELLFRVYTSGKTFVAEEMCVELPRNGNIETRILNFVYQPYCELDGTITGIMAAAIDVTEQVAGRKKVEEINSQLQKIQQRLELALQTGQLGAYERDIEGVKIIASKQFYLNVGHSADANVSFKDIMDSIPLEYREKVRQVQAKCTMEDSVFDVEFPIKWPNNTLHWLRVSGRSGKNEFGEHIISGVSQDITQQKQLQQQKDDFISIASHELKTPITSLKGALQLLSRLKSNPNSPIFPTLIDQANSSLNKVNYLIDDLLNASKMKEGQLELNKSTFVISKLIDDCCQHLRFLGTHEIVIKGDVALEVNADAHRIDQVIVNFINNAIKYAPESKIITVNIEKADGLAKVSVTDNGPGIPTDKLAYLFERYYRVDERGQPYSGLGLGLYICAEIVKRHNGQIGVDSQLGKSSTFWFTLPLDNTIVLN